MLVKISKQKLVIIIGNIGSGKSSALPIVARTLKAATLYADELFHKTDPFAMMYLKDTPRWSFANELWLTVERANLLRHHLNTSKKKVTVVDSGLLMSWIYSYSHFASKEMNRHEWELYQRLYKHVADELVGACCVIYLDYPIATLLQRIKKRGREFEQTYYNELYLTKLRRGLRKLVSNLEEQKIQVIHVKENQIADFENDKSDRKKFLEKIRNEIKL